MRRVHLICFYGVMLSAAALVASFRGALTEWLPVDFVSAASHGTLGVGAGLLLVILSRLMVRLFSWAEALQHAFARILGDFSKRDAFVMALASSVAEEVLFRGVLQSALGLWIASAVFAALHVAPGRVFLPWTLMAFVAGFLFGVLFLWTGNLLAPIIAHFVVNFLNLRALLPAPQLEVFLAPLGGEPFVHEG